MKKLLWAVMLLCVAALPAVAEYPAMHADLPDEGPLLLVELPEDAQLVENVEFENGDYIKSYQLPDGVSVQLLRYEDFDMTLEELAQDEWTGYEAVESMGLERIHGCPAQGIHLRYAEQGQALDVYILRVDAQERVLLMQAVFPGELGEERIGGDMDAMLQSMQVYNAAVMEFGQAVRRGNPPF